MKMSIDKAIDIMERYEMYGFNSQKDGRNKSIEIMRKYQQIEQILDDCDLEAWEVLEMIKEVVEDGNDTTNKRRTKSIP
jgi:hypothetical protein